MEGLGLLLMVLGTLSTFPYTTLVMSFTSCLTLATLTPFPSHLVTRAPPGPEGVRDEEEKRMSVANRSGEVSTVRGNQKPRRTEGYRGSQRLAKSTEPRDNRKEVERRGS